MIPYIIFATYTQSRESPCRRWKSSINAASSGLVLAKPPK